MPLQILKSLDKMQETLDFKERSKVSCINCAKILLFSKALWHKGLPYACASSRLSCLNARRSIITAAIKVSATAAGNRMKGRRACWSIRGATNLANLLCLYHTTGFVGMFTGFVMPATETPSYDCKPLSASKVPLKAGKGYECWSRATVPNLPWLKAITGYQFLAEIRLS